MKKFNLAKKLEETIDLEIKNTKKKISKKRREEIEKFWQDIDRELKLMHRLKSTPFSYHRYAPPSQR